MAPQARAYFAEENTMLDVSSGPPDSMIQAQRITDLAQQPDDWELVIREAHHRMKNTLMLLAASVRMDFRRAGIEEFPAAVDRFERRVVAFGKLYHLLSGGEHSETISIAGFFEPLCKALSETVLEPAAIRCVAAIQDGKLSATQCHRLGLIVTELVTNAAKHAFPDKKAGLIRVEALHRNRCWCITVTDNGRGTTGSPQGTGGRILASLARSIRAQLHYEACQDGTRVKIVVPARI
jgi:two-component sensor histidine kinase